jgi:hypothetical protein
MKCAQNRTRTIDFRSGTRADQNITIFGSQRYNLSAIEVQGIQENVGSCVKGLGKTALNCLDQDSTFQWYLRCFLIGGSCSNAMILALMKQEVHYY